MVDQKLKIFQFMRHIMSHLVEKVHNVLVAAGSNFIPNLVLFQCCMPQALSAHFLHCQIKGTRTLKIKKIKN